MIRIPRNVTRGQDEDLFWTCFYNMNSDVLPHYHPSDFMWSFEHECKELPLWAKHLKGTSKHRAYHGYMTLADRESKKIGYASLLIVDYLLWEANKALR